MGACLWHDNHNIENPELYGVFPYLISGVGKDSLQMGIDTFNNRYHELGATGWSQDAIQAAMLGLTDTAQDLVTEGFLTTDAGSRFIGFHGPNYDWIPDQDQASVATIALQRMLLQVDGEHVELFPAWPSDWDVEFRQFGPNGAIIMGEYVDGAVQWMDPSLDGQLSQTDYWLIVVSLGYDNGQSLGDFASLQCGDVNFDGQVTDDDRVALFAAATAMGIDVSGWTASPIPGDANLDGMVNEVDLQALAAKWGQSGDWLNGDFNDDGLIGPADVAILAANWGYGTSESNGGAVPEPGVLVLLLVGAAMLLVQRRR